jgi:hypothetical protein
MSIPIRGGSLVVGDTNTGAGYGTTKKTQAWAPRADKAWPYAVQTELEADADECADDESENKLSINKKMKLNVALANDRLSQANYKTGAFVNGSTRGLTGIMSGKEPKRVLEQLIDEVGAEEPRKRRRMGDASMSIFGQKPIGNGGVQINTMSSDPTTRTRPGSGLGSKQGWFSPHPPKETDPSNFQHAYSIEDMVSNDESKPIWRANFETRRTKRKNASLK